MSYQWLLLSVFGFSVAGLPICWYIWHSKRKQRPMVCPLNGGCMEVVTSKYSKMFGVNNEVIGALYYAAMAVGALLLFVQPPLAATAFPWLLLGAAALSFLASLYLITIQLFVLKHVCTWCMTTAVINGTLLVLTLQL